MWCTDCTALCTCTTESSRATVSQLRGAAQTGAVRRSVSCSDWSADACRTCSHQALHQHSTVLGRECSEREKGRVEIESVDVCYDNDRRLAVSSQNRKSEYLSDGEWRGQTAAGDTAPGIPHSHHALS